MLRCQADSHWLLSGMTAPQVLPQIGLRYSAVCPFPSQNLPAAIARTTTFRKLFAQDFAPMTKNHQIAATANNSACQTAVQQRDMCMIRSSTSMGCTRRRGAGHYHSGCTWRRGGRFRGGTGLRAAGRSHPGLPPQFHERTYQVIMLCNSRCSLVETASKCGVITPTCTPERHVELIRGRIHTVYFRSFWYRMCCFSSALVFVWLGLCVWELKSIRSHLPHTSCVV